MSPSDEPHSKSSPEETSARADDMGRWIEAARRGDRESLGELFAQCRGYLLAIAHAELDDHLRGKLAVSDVVQETLLRVQQNFAGFRGAGEQELLAWIRQILANYVTDVRRSFRQSGKRDIGKEVRIAGRIDQSTVGLERLAVDSFTPGRAAANAEEIEKLKAALAGVAAGISNRAPPPHLGTTPLCRGRSPHGSHTGRRADAVGPCRATTDGLLARSTR